jgi:signal transduction histidine kinase
MYKTFHQKKDSRGIGLFITKNQIEAMGGKIEVTSTPDIGTTFNIYLKREKD